MTWTSEKSLARIQKLMESVPSDAIDVRDFARDYYPQRAHFIEEARRSEGPITNNPILSLPYNRAVITNGVHIYANLMDFADQVRERDGETEKSHKRAMQFLHLHYGACDRLIEAFELQRVDFHGARLHAVVLTPTGENDERERLVKALAFSAAFREMVKRNNERFGGRYSTRVRVGIDTGPAVAVNSGKRAEPEPLFIGTPANHAAHLAAGSEEGVFLSDRARWVCSLPVSTLGITRLETSDERRYLAEAADLRASVGDRVGARVETALNEYSDYLKRLDSAGLEPAVFQFHYHRPPLRSIDFAQLAPSNAIRMGVGSVLADLDGFTRYVDRSIQTNQVKQAVANLHVLRGEFAGSLREDFGGRKVRFIGDCLHGLVAEGDASASDPRRSVRSALLAAGGLRSSFDLCKSMLGGIGDMGLAVGVEYGWTPICRVGLRGAASIRCATSCATLESERLQQDCTGIETAIGEEAYVVSEAGVRRAFGAPRKLPNFNYQVAVALVDGVSGPAVSRVTTTPIRAHAKECMRRH